MEWSLVKQADEQELLDGDDTENSANEEGYNSGATEVPNIEVPVNAEEHAETTIDPGRVLIGKDRYAHDVYWEFNNKALANRHLLITGTSGQGKTYSIQTMLYELEKQMFPL